MGKAIGIDLGTTNSVVAFKDTAVRIISTGVNNEDLCRSCVACKGGQFYVGNAAYRNWKRYTPNIVVSVKRIMGASITDANVQKMKNDKRSYPYGIRKLSGGTDESVAIILEGKEFTPEQISAEILKSLKNDASDKIGEVSHAVITVPAYFNEKQKSATMKAAELAGIRVQRLLAEPTAAAISYGFEKIAPGEGKQILIYDFGGGTFDLSILQVLGGDSEENTKFIEAGAGGDRWLGGDDIDRILSEYVCSQIESTNHFKLSDLLASKSEKDVNKFYAGLKEDVENAKKTLSQSNNAIIFISGYLENEDDDPVDDITISRSEFESLIRPLVKRTIDLIEELLHKTSIPIDTIDNILLVGGSSCIPLVKQMLTDKYGDKVLRSERPMLAVAEGAAILAHALPCVGDQIEVPESKHVQEVQTEKGFNDLVTHTTKHKYYIKLSNARGKTYLEQIIDSQEVLPFEKNRKFKTSVDNQKIVEVQILTDAEGGGYDRNGMAFFVIPDNLPVSSDVFFKFHLDEDETMNISVKVSSTGKECKIRMGRGDKDSKCLEDISDSLSSVLSNTSISNAKKNVFMNTMQEIVEEITKLNYDASDDGWSSIEYKVKLAVNSARLNNNGVVYGMILVNYFSDYIDPADLENIRKKLAFFESATNDIQREAANDDLKKITYPYGLYINIYIFYFIGEQSNNPQDAGRAKAVFDEMMQSLRNREIDAVNQLLNDNSDLMDNFDFAEGDINFGVVLKN